MSQDPQPTGDVEVKAFESFEIKNESTGEVEAIIATLGVVDHDFEVITRDAIKSGSKVKMSSYGHDIVGFLGAGALPVGKGAVFVEDDKAIFRGKVFVTTERGRDTLEVLKEMGKEQEWSFGFRVMGSEVPDEAWMKKGAQRILTKLDVFEVSPVVMGAGIGTRTLAAKAADQAARKAAADAEVAQKVADDAAAAAAAVAAAAQVDAAEAARLEVEKKEAERTEAERKAQEEAETKRQDEARVELERKAQEEEIRRKARAREDREEYERVQRSLHRMGLR